MEYPVWFLPQVAGGSLIALIAVTHVFVAHFAVGGGLYLVLAERMGLKEGNQEILDFTRRHARFFILVTLVYGSITGVGIWFIISLVQPAGTSLLIHNYVFAWAAEWVLFLVEIIAATVYFYTFGRMRASSHQAIGWIYFISAWFSLFLINGIITFMLSPGGWLEDGSFWAGFFNPTFWPSLFFRTFIAVFMAGIYAFLTISFLKDNRLKRRMTRFSGWWVMVASLGALPAGFWYFNSLPSNSQNVLLQASPQLAAVLQVAIWMTIAAIILSLIFCLLRPGWHNRGVALLVFFCSLGLMGGFEWAREASRRPFVVYETLYSNGIPPRAVAKLDAEGFLLSAKWTRAKEISAENTMTAGEDLFKFQCYACHTLGGLNNDIISRTAGMSYQGLLNYIENLHTIRYFMPPFAGTENEARTLAAWLVKDVHGKELPERVGEVVEADRGRSLFQNRCSPCHGQELIKARTRGWNLDKIYWALDHLPELNSAMPAFTGSAEDKEHLAHFIYALNHPVENGTPSPADLEEPADGAPADRNGKAGEGRQLFEQRCSACHQLRQGGNALAPKLQGWSRQEIRDALDRLPQISPAMPPLNLGPGKKDALADFLAGLEEGEAS